MPKYYRKEIPEAPVFVSGHPYRFDILATEDTILITELDKCVARHVGGVISISKEEYEEEVKKKEQLSLLKNNSKPQQRQEISALRLDARRVVEAVSNPAPRTGMFAKPQVPPAHEVNGGGERKQTPDPIEVPSPDSFQVRPPPIMKLSDIKK